MVSVISQFPSYDRKQMCSNYIRYGVPERGSHSESIGVMSVNSGISDSSHKGSRSKVTSKRSHIYLSVLSSWPMGCSEESELKLLVLYTDLHEFTCNVCGYLQRLEGGISCPRPGVTSSCERLDTSAGNQTQVLRKSSKCFWLLCHLSRSDLVF